MMLTMPGRRAAAPLQVWSSLAGEPSNLHVRAALEWDSWWWLGKVQADEIEKHLRQRRARQLITDRGQEGSLTLPVWPNLGKGAHDLSASSPTGWAESRCGRGVVGPIVYLPVCFARSRATLRWGLSPSVARGNHAPQIVPAPCCRSNSSFNSLPSMHI